MGMGLSSMAAGHTGQRPCRLGVGLSAEEEEEQEVGAKFHLFAPRLPAEEPCRLLALGGSLAGIWRGCGGCHGRQGS